MRRFSVFKRGGEIIIHLAVSETHRSDFPLETFSMKCFAVSFQALKNESNLKTSVFRFVPLKT